MGKGEFSTTTLVVVIIAIAVIVGGVLFVQDFKIELPEFESGMPQFFSISTTPEQGQEGTNFKIDVKFSDKALVYFAQAEIKGRGIIDTVTLYDDGSHGDKRKDDGFYSGIFDSSNLADGEYKIDVVINPSKSQISYENVSEFVVYAGNCIPLVYNGDPNEKIDVAILPGDFTDSEKFRKDALKIIGFPEKNNGILTYEPFKSNVNKFNFYIVNQSLDLGCFLGCYGVDSLACCDNDKVARASSQCPADEVIILLDSNQFCGSASSYAKICNGWNPGQVGTHEFGHIFGGLGDEYVYEDVYPGYEGIISTYPNCDVKECPKWKSFWGGCVEGCGVSVQNRPTEEACLMYTYVDEFDPIDQRHIISLLNKYDEGFVQNVAAPRLEKTYLVDLNYNDGKLSANKVILTNSKAPDRKALNKVDYFAKILDFNGRAIETIKFEFPRLEFPAMPRDEDNFSHSPVVVNNTNYTVLASYHEDASKMEVYDLANNKLLTVDLAYLANVCGDGVCQEHESAVECSEDCSTEQPDDLCTYTKDNVCDPDCVRLDPDCGVSRDNLYLILGGVVALLFVIAALTTKGKK